jgi:hypothetical protein
MGYVAVSPSHWSPPSAEIKNEWSYTSVPPMCLHGVAKGTALLVCPYFCFFMLCVSCTIILPVVLYGCETWSLILREERRLRVFENRVLKRIFGPKRDEVT